MMIIRDDNVTVLQLYMTLQRSILFALRRSTSHSLGRPSFRAAHIATCKHQTLRYGSNTDQHFSTHNVLHNPKQQRFNERTDAHHRSINTFKPTARRPRGR